MAGHVHRTSVFRSSHHRRPWRWNRRTDGRISDKKERWSLKRLEVKRLEDYRAFCPGLRVSPDSEQRHGRVGGRDWNFRGTCEPALAVCGEMQGRARGGQHRAAMPTLRCRENPTLSPSTAHADRCPHPNSPRDVRASVASKGYSLSWRHA